MVMAGVETVDKHKTSMLQDIEIGSDQISPGRRRDRTGPVTQTPDAIHRFGLPRQLLA
jgi:hypothetical protein